MQLTLVAGMWARYEPEIWEALIAKDPEALRHALLRYGCTEATWHRFSRMIGVLAEISPQMVDWWMDRIDEILDDDRILDPEYPGLGDDIPWPTDMDAPVE